MSAGGWPLHVIVAALLVILEEGQSALFPLIILTEISTCSQNISCRFIIVMVQQEWPDTVLLEMFHYSSELSS